MAASPDIVCLSHLRWDFVYQRPQHLLSRFARRRRVFFVEEAVRSGTAPALQLRQIDDRLTVATPQVPAGFDAPSVTHVQAALLDDLLARYEVCEYVLWYYTPMALAFTSHLAPRAVVYDCMDELSAFLGAPQSLQRLEQELFERADIVFAGGWSLYEAKRLQHGNVHYFPSSVDARHFGRARRAQAEPPDQATIPHPRLGFFGVIDERIDLDLVADLAAARPAWQLVLVGPVVKIDPACLPTGPNIHYLGRKSYKELPAYLAGWDVALLPFARNAATRFISPTKTPEYLAAGRPVVSTSIPDVVRSYGSANMVRFGDNAGEFASAVEAALHADPAVQLSEVDALLADTSWDTTWLRMEAQLGAAVAERSGTAAAGPLLQAETFVDRQDIEPTYADD